MASSMLDQDLTPVDVRVDDRMIRVSFNGDLKCMKMTSVVFEEIYNGPFPVELLAGRPQSSNGQLKLSLSTLRSLNPSHLQQVKEFSSINQWFQAAPELADVA